MTRFIHAPLFAAVVSAYVVKYPEFSLDERSNIPDISTQTHTFPEEYNWETPLTVPSVIDLLEPGETFDASLLQDFRKTLPVDVESVNRRRDITSSFWETPYTLGEISESNRSSNDTESVEDVRVMEDNVESEDECIFGVTRGFKDTEGNGGKVGDNNKDLAINKNDEHDGDAGTSGIVWKESEDGDEDEDDANNEENDKNDNEYEDDDDDVYDEIYDDDDEYDEVYDDEFEDGEEYDEDSVTRDSSAEGKKSLKFVPSFSSNFKYN